MDTEALEFVIEKLHELEQESYELIKDKGPFYFPEKEGDMESVDVAYHNGRRDAYLVALNYVSGLWDGEYDKRPPPPEASR